MILKFFHYPILIEIDGGVHREEQVIEQDYNKWRYAIKKGYLLVRFTNKEAYSDFIIREMENIIRGCAKVPREIWLYKYTFLDWIKDKWRHKYDRNIKRK